jgi:hypothetical protein
MNLFARLWMSFFGPSLSKEAAKPNPPREVATATTPKAKTSLELRKELISIARLDLGKTEVTKNQAPFIKKYWPATSYPTGYANREPYCAAAGAYWIREWLKLPDVLKALKMDATQAEKWRCKSARVFDWSEWAKAKGLKILPKNSILHVGDIVIYSYSHWELVVDDDGTTTGPFQALGANTDSAGSRDGEGVYLKPRKRTQVKHFIRILP